MALLDALFPDGAAYCLGAVNRDCWYLYTLNPMPAHLALPSAEPDQTLEILMTELDPEIMAIFTREECLDAAEATKKAGIDKIIPNMVIDDFLFEPCGYSMNGITKNVSWTWNALIRLWQLLHNNRLYLDLLIIIINVGLFFFVTHCQIITEMPEVSYWLVVKAKNEKAL